MQLVLEGSPASPPDPGSTPLPPIREDLGLFRAPRNRQGEPGWMLHDPPRNRYFRIGVAEFEMLSCWHEAQTCGELAARLAGKGQVLSVDDVNGFVEFLHRNELTQLPAGDANRLLAFWKARERRWWMRLLHNYLFLRIPLVRPDPWLDRFYPLLRPLMSRRFLQVTLCAGGLGLFLVLQQWELFWATFQSFLSLEGAAAFAVTLGMVKVLHECGHALACRHFGLRVPTIGVALIVMWPVMYTDATEAWRLTSRRGRVAIAAAGMLTELAIACYATLAWVMLPDGLLRSLAFLLATTTWTMSLLVNLNPLVRFDGYYLLSDFVDIPNLQDRGMVLARHQLRHWLFGSPPARDPGLDDTAHRIALAWAYVTWIYRFVLFLGIALLVYLFFFKALGIFLFLVEIWWFIAAPIWREIREWPVSLSAMSARRRLAYGIGGAVLLLLVLVPWQTSFLAPGLLRLADYQALYPAESGQILVLNMAHGKKVRAGDELVVLGTPELDSRLVEAEAALAGASQEVARVSSDVQTASERLVAEQRAAQAQAALSGLGLRRDGLRLVAPFDGEVLDVPAYLRAGDWVGERQRLGVLVGTGHGLLVDSWVAESHLSFVKPGDRARFYPDEPDVSPLEGAVLQVDSVDTRMLAEPYLAESMGGTIRVRQDKDGRLVPEEAIYRVRLEMDKEPDAPVTRVVRGQVRFIGDNRNLVSRLWTLVAGTVIRESGF